jgi:hypothetical protein
MPSLVPAGRGDCARRMVQALKDEGSIKLFGVPTARSGAGLGSSNLRLSFFLLPEVTMAYPDDSVVHAG